MDDMLRRKPVTLCYDGFSCFTALELPAFLQQFWTCSAMNCTIDTAPSEKGTVGSIYYGVDLEPGYITLDDSYYHMHASRNKKGAETAPFEIVFEECSVGQIIEGEVVILQIEEKEAGEEIEEFDCMEFSINFSNSTAALDAD